MTSASLASLPAIASLPMYDWPGLRAATDAWWQAIAIHLRALGMPVVPDHLTRSKAPGKDWSSASLLFSQTCGLPFTEAFAHRLTLLAVPVYRVPGCGCGTYSSAIIVRQDDQISDIGDIRGLRAVCNAPDSMSGMLALAIMAAPLAGSARVFRDVVWSGSHRNSMLAVAGKRADIAAIDAVTWAIAGQEMPDELKNLRILAWSPKVPCLPYVTSAQRSNTDVERLKRALKLACDDLRFEQTRLSLLIEGVEFLPRDAYDVITAYKNKISRQFLHNEFGIS